MTPPKKRVGGHHRSPHDLARFRNFSGLSPRKLGILSSRISVRRSEAQSVIFREGQPGDNVYIMLSGVARVTCLNFKGERVLLEFLGPGDLIGIHHLLPAICRDLQCDALTDCQLGLIGLRELVEDIVGISISDFSLALNLGVGRWWRLLVRQSNFIDQGLHQRIVLALLELGSKFGVQDDRGTIIDLRWTHQDLAHIVGGSRPKVSSYMRELAERGALVQERRRVIIQRKKLEAILSSFGLPAANRPRE